MRNFILICFGMALLAMLSTCGPAPDSEKYDHSGKKTGMIDMPDSSRKMPAFALPSAVDGAVVTSETFQGKVLLIVFFAAWCRTCVDEAVTLEKLQKKFNSQVFSIVGLSLDRSGPAGVAIMIRKMGITYPVFMADDTIAGEFGPISAVPVSFLVDRHGNIRKKYFSHIDHENIERDIKSLLSAP